MAKDNKEQYLVVLYQLGISFVYIAVYPRHGSKIAVEPGWQHVVGLRCRVGLSLKAGAWPG